MSYNSKHQSITRRKFEILVSGLSPKTLYISLMGVNLMRSEVRKFVSQEEVDRSKRMLIILWAILRRS
jgi:hypothetical protein